MGPASSIVIPTRNRAAVLRHSLPCILGQETKDAFEVIVVDDASDDETAQVVAGLAQPNLIYRRLETHSAAAYARNRAIDLTRGTILVFLDDDSFVGPDFLERHLDAHRDRPGAIVTGPIVEVSEMPSAWPPSRRRFAGWHANPFPTGNASVARDAVRGAGGFDEDFRAYGWEDPELYRRLARTGLRRVFTWTAPIFHYKSRETRQDFLGRLSLERQRGAMGALFYAKHPQFSVGLRTKQLAVVRALDRLLDRALGLESLVNRVLASGEAPNSPLLRLLMLNHVEIDAGRRASARSRA